MFSRPDIRFVERRRTWALFSAGLLVLALAGLLGRGLQLSIDFEGGTSFIVEGVGAVDVTPAQLSDAARGAGAADVTAQLTTEDGLPTGAIVRAEALPPGGEVEAAVVDALQDAADAQDVDVTFVGPSWGERVSSRALQALVVFLVVVVLYISLRLEPKMAGASLVALVHDVVLTVGLYALAGFTVSPSTVIALLTILGYSLYDSVVIFDRIEENALRIGEPGLRTYSEVVDTSMNDVLWRSINTSLTSLLPVGALLFLGAQLLGATTLQDLALALFIGMALGAYSSIFVAGPLLAVWKEREPEYANLRDRLESRIERGAKPADPTPEPTSAAPVTTEYVRGRGRRNRRQRKR